MTSSTTAPVSGSAPSGARGARVATDPAVRRPRSVLVTGASRGIGAAVAAAMAAQGDRVAGLSRTGTAPDGVLGVVADVTDPDAVDAVVRRAAEEHGPVEVLVAAAGTSLDALAARTRPADWDRVIATNLTGSMSAARAVLPGMMRARRGRIVLVSSVMAARGGAGLAAYGASKGGVEGLARSLAREVAPRGITVNVVAPGLVDTALTAGLSDAAREQYLAAIPMGRTADLGEVVAPVLFLASPAASYVTGTVLGVDGGLGMGR
ncbi:SDR family oxidoreductase [Actinomyces haliotis]